eukprot:13389903-Alexandrium_andersonii.AAC.1
MVAMSVRPPRDTRQLPPPIPSASTLAPTLIVLALVTASAVVATGASAVEPMAAHPPPSTRR